MPRVERFDKEDSFETLFRIETSPGNHQEFNVPIFIADLVEKGIKSNTFDTDKRRKGKKKVLD